jgi:hypothetical protein
MSVGHRVVLAVLVLAVAVLGFVTTLVLGSVERRALAWNMAARD